MTAKKALLISEPPLQVLPSLAMVIGLNEAIAVQQLHYWLENPKSGVTRDGFKWVYNTYEDWRENFPFWSIRTIQRIFLNLEELGVVIAAQLDKNSYDRKKYYRINYDKLDALTVPPKDDPRRQERALDDDKLAPSLDDSETTPETTREDGAKPAPPPVPGMSIENQIAVGVEHIVMPTGDQEYQDKIEFAMMNICKGARNIQPLALAFLTTRGIFPSKSEYLGWRKAFLQMYEKHVTAENVVEAIGRLLHDQMTVVEPYAVIKTAVSLANPPPETPPVTFSDVSV